MKQAVLFLFLCVSLAASGQPEDYVWASPSRNSSESMPCGGGDVGLNVWVEQGDILFYVSRSGSFDENNTLLKQGRVRLKLSPGLQTTANFRQRLCLNDGYVEITDGEKTVQIWSDVFHPVVHIDVTSRQNVSVEAGYESWRFEDRPMVKRESFQSSYKFGAPKGTFTHADVVDADARSITFYHQNPDSTVFDATVDQQQLSRWKAELFNPLGRRVFGGRLSGRRFHFADTYSGRYDRTDYRGWRLVSDRPSRRHALQIALADVCGSPADWQRRLVETERSVDAPADRVASRRWWNAFWQRSFVYSDTKACRSALRNYMLFRYMLGCNARGQWPTKFNGGLFCFDPSFVDTLQAFTPDYRRWGGGPHTAQNQRLVYWPMLKNGDFDALKPQLDFYLNTLRTAEIRSRCYWNHAGACFTEQIENFGLPNHDEYGRKRPAGFDAGIEYNAWLEYTWDTVLEFCQMALDAESYSGESMARYVPLVRSCIDFFDEHYRMLAQQRGRKALTDDGRLVIYPGSACETFKMAYNPSSTVAALQVVTRSLVEWLERNEADTAVIHHYQRVEQTIPPLPTRVVEGREVIAPAAVWARVNNTETPHLYPVFPWRLFGVGRDSLQLALDTWRYDPYVRRFYGYVGWEQYNIWAACLGQTDEACALMLKKMGDGPHRFPAFWGPGHDWTPDHNWGGSGMIGVQEMLMQEADGRILLFPSWPQEWNVHFKLHASRRTTVEATLRNGRVFYSVEPASRAKDVVVCLPSR
ncbi:MAG: hypothetical protein IJV27_09975 [Prevotella sp.]|nr:hypothetical protein [Prevotella sp.]